MAQFTASELQLIGKALDHFYGQTIAEAIVSLGALNQTQAAEIINIRSKVAQAQTNQTEKQGVPVVGQEYWIKWPGNKFDGITVTVNSLYESDVPPIACCGALGGLWFIPIDKLMPVTY